MKTIFLKVEVPDDFNEISDFSRIEIKEVSSGNVIYDEVKFTEITLPTDEEKLSAASEKYPIIKDLSIAFHGAFCEGANWAINKMKGE